MHAHWIDQYRQGDSLIHQLDARIKLLLTFAYALTVSLAPPGVWLGYALLLALALGAALLSRLGLGWIQRRALVVLPFALAAVTLIFSTGGPPLFHLSLGPWQLTASEPGLVRFLSIMLKSWLSVQMAAVLVGSTPFPELMNALRALHFPPILLAIVALMWRYVFVLTDQALRLMRAREARSAARPGYKSGGRLVWRARVVGGMTGSLFLRSYARSERIYQAMAARGYQGELRALTAPHLQRRDIALGLIVAAYLAAVLLGSALL